MWKITEDLINPQFENPENMPSSRNYQEGADLPFKFRLLDDDDEVYFEGQSNDQDTDHAFDPLDDFGTPGYGCTSIEYLRDGAWKQL